MRNPLVLLAQPDNDYYDLRRPENPSIAILL